jgi:hypothetical protein
MDLINEKLIFKKKKKNNLIHRKKGHSYGSTMHTLIKKNNEKHEAGVLVYQHA